MGDTHDLLDSSINFLRLWKRCTPPEPESPPCQLALLAPAGFQAAALFDPFEKEIVQHAEQHHRQQLLDQHGFYHHLYLSQFKGEQI
jgi:hypothetical protein